MGGVGVMIDAFFDYMRLTRAGAVMARHDVIIPDVYKARAPWFARAAGTLLRLCLLYTSPSPRD